MAKKEKVIKKATKRYNKGASKVEAGKGRIKGGGTRAVQNVAKGDKVGMSAKALVRSGKRKVKSGTRKMANNVVRKNLK